MTGKLVWNFHTVPHPGEFGYETWPKDACKYVGGTNTWGELTVDAEARHRVLSHSARRPSTSTAPIASARTCSAPRLLALDARTGKRLWHFQMVHHDLWDFDPNAAPQLTTHQRNGQNIDVVALAGKTGFLYVFDRVTGEPIWPIEERPVPKSDMPGEQIVADPALPDQPAAVQQADVHASTTSIRIIVRDAERETFKDRLAAPQSWDCSRRFTSTTRCTFRAATAAPCSAHSSRAEERHGLRDQPGQPGHPASRPGIRKPARAARPGRRTSGNARSATDPTALRPDGPSLLDVPGRLDAATFARR